MSTINYTNWLDVLLGLRESKTNWDLSERLQMFIFREKAFPFNYRHEVEYLKNMSYEACFIMDNGPHSLDEINDGVLYDTSYTYL